MKKIASLLMLLCIVSTGFAKKKELSLNLEKGKVYYQVMNSKGIINQTINGQQMEINMVIGATLSFKVTSISEGDYIMEMQYEAMQLSMDMPQSSVSFNSADSLGDNPVSQMLSTIIKKPFNLKMDQKGNVLEVYNLEEMWDNVTVGMSDLPEEKRAQIQNQLKEAYGENSIKGNTQLVTAIFPDQPVETGDSWVIDIELKTPIPQKVKTTYTLKKWTKEHIILEGESEMSTDDSQTSNMNGMNMVYDLSGNMVSNITLSAQTGWTVNSSITQNLEGAVTVIIGEDDSQKMSMGTKMRNVMTVTDK